MGGILINGQIYVPRAYVKSGINYLAQNGYQIKIGNNPTEREMIRDVADCDAILLRTLQITRPIIEAGKKLKVIARCGVGIDNIDLEAAAERGIWVTTTPSANSNSVAEYTMGCILAVSRNFLPLIQAAKQGDFFLKNSLHGCELDGKTLGIVGLGRVGQLVARKAALGFNMSVIASRYERTSAELPDYIRIVNWDELFSRSDYISLHIPLRPENVGVVGKREFAMMKSSAYLINASRGSIVDEAALIEALSVGAIAGAGIDVFEQEPPALDNPLFGFENVFATPHIGANTNEALERMSLNAAMEIARVLSGKTPRWPVHSDLR